MINKSDQRVGLKWWLVGWLGKGLVDLTCSTTRIEVIGFENVRGNIESGKFILAFWHSRILMISHIFKGWGGVALVSRSEDGEIIAQILHRQGQETIRGSTSRNAVRALARLIKVLKEEIRPGAMIPDGPRGPRFKVQPGVIALAQKTGYPIVPVSYSAKRLKVFASWDRFILPYPFNKSRVIYGTSIYVPLELDSEAREHCRLMLEEELNRITKTVDSYYGHQID
ncbi:MAG: lysophospholipid acyltransferase family protein [Deltaproteobacteria bacterium]|nr:lysophospholipid acyltransferase family protein [Deltaproteobacteria bacterium]